jgi:subtilase family serine protease
MLVKAPRLLSLVLLATSSMAVTPTAGAAPNDHANARAVCAAPTVEAPSCLVQVATQPGSGTPITSTVPVGYGPAQFHGAYNVPTTAAAAVTIAVIVGFDNPNVKADLDVYDTAFGLPPFPTCSSSVTKACFQKVAQKRSITTDQVWALESSMDVQTVHQMCQNCKILLVEGTTNSWSNLMWAVDTAVSMGAQVVNSSFAGLESSATLGFDTHYNHPGVVFTAASGDWGYDVRYPASSQYVTSVGGTTLTVDANNQWASETVWSKTGSGCSAYSPKPFFQQDAGCAGRTVSDVSADADPATGAAVYDSTGYNGTTGWFQLAGTSLSAPLIAGVYALAGVTAGERGNSIPYLHGAATNLHDIASGRTATCGSYLCEGALGYDGPTGLGTPNGVSAFR